jgi:hypothetical protein
MNVPKSKPFLLSDPSKLFFYHDWYIFGQSSERFQIMRALKTITIHAVDYGYTYSRAYPFPFMDDSEMDCHFITVDL